MNLCNLVGGDRKVYSGKDPRTGETLQIRGYDRRDPSPEPEEKQKVKSVHGTSTIVPNSLHVECVHTFGLVV